MPKQSTLIRLACAAAAFAAINAEPVQAHTAYSALRAHCLKQVGAYYNPDRKRWTFYGARSSPQRQNFYNCLDSHTMKRR